MMKKLVNAGKVLTIASLIALTGCKKDSKTAFPSQPNAGGSVSETGLTFFDYSYIVDASSGKGLKDADGILASVHAHNYRIVTISPVVTDCQYGFSAFTTSPSCFVCSPVYADSVTVNGTSCINSGTSSGSFLYYSDLNTYSLGFSSSINWYVKGNSSVPAMTNNVTAVDPTYSPFSISASSTTYTTNFWSDTWLPTYPKTLTVVTTKPTNAITPPAPTAADSARWIADSTTFKTAMALYQSTLAKHVADSIYNLTPYAYIPLSATINSVVKNYVSNADTVFVSYNDGSGFNFAKRVAATDSTIALIPNDFIGYPTYKLANMVMQLNLVKYNPVTVGSKKYYYLNVGSYLRYWKAN